MMEYKIPEYRMCKRCGLLKTLDKFYNGASVCKLCLKPRTQKYIIEELEEKEKTFEWVYRNLERFGNCLIAKKNYNKLDFSRIGKHSLKVIKKDAPNEQTCYVITLG